MPAIKIGKYWYYDFWLNGQHYKKSTGSKNRQTAVDAESKLREELSREAMGLPVIKTAEIPTLKHFIEKEFDPWANNEYGTNQRKTYIGWYRTNCRVLAAHEPLASKRLHQITEQDIAQFKKDRQNGKGFKKCYKVTSVNRTLGVLARIYVKAVEWKFIEAGSVPKIRKVKGEGGRKRVVSHDEERKFLAACDILAYQVQAILFDTGMRPDECYRMRWEDMAWDHEAGAIVVQKGKTENAAREIPMTTRVREILESRLKAAGEPVEGWIFPSDTQSGHIMDSSLRKQRKKAFERMNEVARMRGEKPVKPWDIYTARHTFLTRLGCSGCDVHTLMRIAGHADVEMASRYVHPTQQHVRDKMEQLSRQSH